MDRRREFVSTSELIAYVENKEVLLIDIRSVNAYNGWSEKGEKRGGHIPGSLSLPINWIRYMDWLDIVHSKGIFPANDIVIYGYDGKESGKVAGMLKQAGYGKVRIYSDFLIEWVEDDKLPMSRLERHEKLVSAQWVEKLISGETPDSYENNEFIVVHAHYRNRDAYLSGHIPGAIDMDTLALESPETWNRRSPEELKLALEQHGITSDTTVVLYGKFMSPDNDDLFPGSAWYIH